MVDMQKRVETAAGVVVDLGKKAQAIDPTLDDLSMQVVLVLDFSISMESRYSNDEVQDLAERCLALALTGLDDDGNIQVVFFANSVVGGVNEVDINNYQGFVRTFKQSHSMGGTSYAPAISTVLDMFKGGLMRKAKLRSDIPTLVLFVTDGQPQDQTTTERLIFDSADKPIFWQFMGLGYSPEFLNKLDTMEGRVVDNANVFDVTSSKSMPDEEFFPKVLTECITNWLPEIRRLGMVK